MAKATGDLLAFYPIRVAGAEAIGPGASENEENPVSKADGGKKVS